jgi:hypothetical protein
MINSEVKKWFVQLDFEWCQVNIEPEKLTAIEVTISGNSNEIWIYDEKGNKLKNFLQMEDELPFDEKKLVNNSHFYSFDNGFVRSENCGLVKIKGVHIVYDTSIGESQWMFDGEQITKAIVKNVLTGEMKFIKTDA